MSQEENPSKFNGLILEIAGKGVVEHSYSDQNNQHQIAIGLPKLDNAERQIKFSQYDLTTGNLVKEVDLSAYPLIEIVEVRQQSPNTQESRDSINIGAALSRNQERLSGFYQSYKLEDSSIDWSKIATKITLPNTSGVFYDHDDKYTVGFKIELSPQGVEGVEFRDGTGETIATLSYTQQFYTDMVIGNLCQIDLKSDVGNPLQATFCSPTTQVTSVAPIQYSKAPDTFYLCVNCGVLYTSNYPNQSCFAGGTHSPAQSSTTGLSYKFLLPYDIKPTAGWLNEPNTTTPDDTGCGEICVQCSMVVYNSNLACSSSNNNKHNCSSLENDEFAYWIYTRAQANNNTSTITQLEQRHWHACSKCGGLYWRNIVPPPPPVSTMFQAVLIGNKCVDKNKHEKNTTQSNFTLILKNNIAIVTNNSYLNGHTISTDQSVGKVDLQTIDSATSDSGTFWELEQPDSTQGDYRIKCLSFFPNKQAVYLTGNETTKTVALGGSPQTWQIVQDTSTPPNYNLQVMLSEVTYYLICNTSTPPILSISTTKPSTGVWQISIL